MVDCVRGRVADDKLGIFLYVLCRTDQQRGSRQSIKSFEPDISRLSQALTVARLAQLIIRERTERGSEGVRVSYNALMCSYQCHVNARHYLVLF